MGDSFEVWMENATFGIEGLAVSVVGAAWIESLGEFVLGFGGGMALVFEDENRVLV